MKRCLACKGRLQKRLVEETLEVGGHRFVASLPGRVCADCGESYLDAKTLERFELTVAVYLALAGETTGEVFKFIRKAVGMKATELADLLEVAPETISRWETDGRAVDRGAFVLIADMAREALEGRAGTLDMLKSQRAPRRLAKTVRLGRLVA
jgi:putative zinc finger/helix-turn-helix YgiT family protein